MIITRLTALAANDTPARTTSYAVETQAGIELRNLKDSDCRFRGRHCPGDVAIGQHAFIVPGKSIRLFGFVVEAGVSRSYDRTYEIGDAAEYDSYNLSYYGRIHSITRNTVVIVDGSAHRLNIYQFARRNRSFDLQALRSANRAVMDRI